MSNPGFRIKQEITRPDEDLVQSFRHLPVANIGDCMNRIKCMNARIKHMNSAPLLGTAVTVKVRAGDNLLLHKAIDMAQPGDVIILDAQGELSYAITGELMISWMRRRGLAGLVVDGCIRDIDAIRCMDDFPVYAAGVTPNGPLKEGGGEINFPVMCGGLIVNPGDIIVGDSDGVICIDPLDAPAVLEQAQIKSDQERQEKEAIRNLAWPREWVDATLTAKGCEIIA